MDVEAELRVVVLAGRGAIVNLSGTTWRGAKKDRFGVVGGRKRIAPSVRTMVACSSLITVRMGGFV